MGDNGQGVLIDAGGLNGMPVGDVFRHLPTGRLGVVKAETAYDYMVCFDRFLDKFETQVVKPEDERYWQLVPPAENPRVNRGDIVSRFYSWNDKLKYSIASYEFRLQQSSYQYVLGFGSDKRLCLFNTTDLEIVRKASPITDTIFGKVIDADPDRRWVITDKGYLLHARTLD